MAHHIIMLHEYVLYLRARITPHSAGQNAYMVYLVSATELLGVHPIGETPQKNT